MRIIRLNGTIDLFGVYGTRVRGPFGTPLLFKGTLEDCIAFKRA